MRASGTVCFRPNTKGQSLYSSYAATQYYAAGDRPPVEQRPQGSGVTKSALPVGGARLAALAADARARRPHDGDAADADARADPCHE